MSPKPPQKGWTPERRAAQAARCRKNKPSQHSTGPKTEAGKARSSANAYKHGCGGEWGKSFKRMLKHHKLMLHEYIYWNNKLKEYELKQQHIQSKTKNEQTK